MYGCGGGENGNVEGKLVMLDGWECGNSVCAVIDDGCAKKGEQMARPGWKYVVANGMGPWDMWRWARVWW